MAQGACIVPLRCLALLFGSIDAIASGATLARAWLDSIQLPTYQEGAAVATPQFELWNPDAPNYPYPVRSEFTTLVRPRSWATINLENEYLLCRVIPDLGGHLYSCLDKRNNREMFYANPVVKPAFVGLRGSWVAMGIESSFPAGHT